MIEFAPATSLQLLRPWARRHPAASRGVNPSGASMSTSTTSRKPRRMRGRSAFALLTFVASLIMAIVPLLGLTTTAARACACGCSVFDVGGGMLPQENDHGGRVFVEYWDPHPERQLDRQLQGKSQSQPGQEAQHRLVQCGLQLQLQPSVGGDGPRPLRQSRLHHHGRSGGRPSADVQC